TYIAYQYTPARHIGFAVRRPPVRSSASCGLSRASDVRRGEGRGRGLAVPALRPPGVVGGRGARAADGAGRVAALRRHQLPPEVVPRVAEDRLRDLAPRLRAPAHVAVLVDVEVARARAAAKRRLARLDEAGAVVVRLAPGAPELALRLPERGELLG